tara:strand:+ start:543 stop:1460 length:918 start_codon:yes stop_codon:yes gene_type:complete
MAFIQKLGLEALEFLKNLVIKAGQDVNNLPDAPSGDFGALKNLPFGMIRREGTPPKFSYKKDEKGNLVKKDGPIYDVFSPGGFSGAEDPLTAREFKSIFSQQKDIRQNQADFGEIIAQDNLNIQMLRDKIKVAEEWIEGHKEFPDFLDVIPSVRSDIFRMRNELMNRTRPEIVPQNMYTEAGERVTEDIGGLTKLTSDEQSKLFKGEIIDNMEKAGVNFISKPTYLDEIEGSISSENLVNMQKDLGINLETYKIEDVLENPKFPQSNRLIDTDKPIIVWDAKNNKRYIADQGGMSNYFRNWARID